MAQNMAAADAALTGFNVFLDTLQLCVSKGDELYISDELLMNLSDSNHNLSSAKGFRLTGQILCSVWALIAHIGI